MRRVLRCIGDAETLAHRIVDLRRVQPHMRVGERQPVRHQPRPRDAQCLPRGVVGRGGKCLLRTTADSGSGEVSAASRRPISACAKAATRAGSGASGQQIELLADRIECLGGARGERFGRRQRW